jgi:hypothetical protein
MTQHARFAVFSLASAFVYVLAYNFGWQLFRYYPLLNKITIAALPAKESGPTMMYYGWIGTAALAGLAVALIVPNKIAAKLPSATGWVVPLLLVAFTLVYEKHWFL